MHTSAPQSALLAYTGTLTHGAQARSTTANAEGHTIPVLVLDLQLDNTLHTPMRVEQFFPTGQHAQAHAAAQRLKKGMRVTVQAPMRELSLIARHAVHIHVEHDPAQAHARAHKEAA